jgi:hypothetical protein
MRVFVHGLAALAGTVLVLAGCGSSDNTASPVATFVPSAAPPAGVQVTPTPTATPALTATPPVPTASATGTPPESQPGGAGDEEGPNIVASFAVTAGAVIPTSVSVPAFFPVDIRVDNRTQAPLRVVLAGKPTMVAPGTTGRLHSDGFKTGKHALMLGEGEATIIAGNNAGP